MSHFTVMVLGEDIDEQMKPFCEHDEITKEFHSFVDCTDEVLKDWKTDTVSEWYPKDRIETELRNIEKLRNGEEIFVNPNERSFSMHTPKVGDNYQLFYRKNLRVEKVYVRVLELIHDGMLVYYIPSPKKISVQLTYDNIDDYADEYHGYKKNEDGKYGYYANKNAKWDWYQIGGRWSGFFKYKENADGVIGIGEPGLMTPAPREGYADSLLKKDIDIAYMINEAKEEAIKEYDAFMEIFGDIEIPSWNKIRKSHGKDNIDDAREEFNNTEYNKMIHELDRKENKYASSWIWAGDIHEYFNGFDKEKFIISRMGRSFAPFAIVKNGQWIQRGEMGWWGCVSDEKEDWPTEFCRIFSSIAPDTRITILDCHI